MKRRHVVLVLTLIALLLALSLTAVSFAQSSASYDLTWHTIAGGGGPSSSASYAINGTVGQSAASPPSLTSGSFRLGAGYWFSLSEFLRVFVPSVFRNATP